MKRVQVDGLVLAFNELKSGHDRIKEPSIPGRGNCEIKPLDNNIERLHSNLDRKLAASLDFDVRKKISKLPFLDQAQSSRFRKWLQNRLFSSEKGDKHLPNADIIDTTASYCESNVENLAAIMVYWAEETCVNALTMEDKEFRVLLLYSAASIYRRIHEDARNFALSALADLLSGDPELIHQQATIFEDEELAWQVSKAHPLISRFREDQFGFFLFMEVLALGNDVLLDEEDFTLLSNLVGASKFSFHDCRKQFEDHGICMQLTADVEIPEGQQNVPILTFGDEKISFLVDISRLSSLGLSAFALLLTPSTPNKLVFKEVAIRVNSFNNCLIHEISGKDLLDMTPDKPERPDLEVFVPLPWLYQFNLFPKFIDEHGSFGSVGALLGNLDDHPVHYPHESTGKKQHFPALSKGRKEAKKRERLYLDKEYRLVFNKTPAHRYQLTGFSAAVKAVFAEIAIKAERSTAECGEGHIYPFISFQHFITYPFCNSLGVNGFMKRIKWLEKALKSENVFPEGTNQSLLKNVVDPIVSCNETTNVFVKPDCRLKWMSLRNRGLPFKVLHLIERKKDNGGDIGYVFFKDLPSDENELPNVSVLPCKRLHEDTSDGLCFTGECREADQRELPQLQNAEEVCSNLL
ncbi:hypothetical protein FGB62_156g05 [Gracilaria domingensis]|nr:hypothetical protein FGB62_156g05 [Gracilaria domingensis]